MGTLTLATATYNTATSVSYGFTANFRVATTNKITLVLPSMSGTNGALTATVGTSNGCGTATTCGGVATYASQSTFTAVLASQGQAGANVVFTVATGLTNANANQAANLASRTAVHPLNQPDCQRASLGCRCDHCRFHSSHGRTDSVSDSVVDYGHLVRPIDGVPGRFDRRDVHCHSTDRLQGGHCFECRR